MNFDMFIKRVLVAILIITLFLNAAVFSEANVINENIVQIVQTDAQTALTKQIKESTRGDTIIFGRYEQNNVLSDGKEPVEWLLLYKNEEDKTAVLISKYILDCLRFNGLESYIAWDNSPLRTYMNNEMLQTLFTFEEIRCIKPTYLANSINVFYQTYSGEPTVDHIYIPGIDEIYVFFGSDNFVNEARFQELLRPNNNRVCKATKYAISRGVRVIDNNTIYRDAGNYLLRTSGLNGYRVWYGDKYTEFYQSYVTEHGALRPDGTGINSNDDGIRVMMQVYY